MGRHTRTRAVLAGLGTLGLTEAEGFIIAAVVFALLLFTDVRLAAWAYRHGMDAGAEVMLGFGLLVGGYVAASRVERGKVLAGLLLGVVLLLLSIGMAAPLVLLSEGVPPKTHPASGWWDYAGTLVVPIVGALLQARRGERGRPVYPLRMIGLLISYDLLLVGLLVAVGALLLVGHFPGKWGPFAKWQVWVFALLPLLLPAYALLLLHNRGGLKRRVLRQPAAWACVAAVGWFAFCFVHDNRVNRWDSAETRDFVAQMNARDKIPDAKNGAGLVREAQDDIRALHYPEEDRPSGLWAPEQHHVWAAYLQEAAPALALARKAARMPLFYRSKYTEVEGEGGYAENRAERHMRSLVRPMVLQATRTDVSFDESLGWLDVVVRLSVPMRLNGGIGSLTCDAAGRKVSAAMRDLITAGHPDAAQLKRAEALLRDWEEAEKPDREAECLGVRMEAMALTWQMYSVDPKDQSLTRFLGFLVYNRRYLTGLFRPMVESYCSDLRSRPFYQVLRLHPPAPIVLGFPTGKDPFETADMIFEGSFGYAADMNLRVYLRIAAQMHILRAYVAAELMYRATGRLPAGWRDLVPAYLDGIPEDPFDGSQLRLRPSAGGVSFSSVGPDGKDAGGKGFFSEEELSAAQASFEKANGHPGDLPDDIVLVFRPAGALAAKTKGKEAAP